MNKTVELTKQLVAIPSWVGAGCNEIKASEFIYDWLQKNTDLSVIKQPVKDGRFNVIATDGSPTRIILAGHMDTVEPRAGWNTDPFTPKLKDGKLYGLGSTDMKGSLAAMLIAISETKNTKGLMFLCYIDEEYDFAGMRAFVQEYKDKLEPKLIISLDGSIGQVGIGCRGLIELSYKIRGVTGHAGTPSVGKNAIRIGSRIIDQLEADLAKITDPILGMSTCNLAYAQGGLDLGNNLLGRQGNNIPNIAEFVLDIRTSQNKIRASWVSKRLQKYGKEFGVTVEDVVIRHNLGSWNTRPYQLTQLGIIGKYKPSLGYIDTQMLWETFGQVPSCAIGAGLSGQDHVPNEYVRARDLTTATDAMCRIIAKQVGSNKP